MARNSRTFTALLLAAGIAFASGCGGQGGYTRQASSMAKEKMNILKSGTEWEMARQAFLAGDLQKALRKVDNSLAVNPSVTKSHVLKGRILLEMGNVGQALRSLQTALAISPDDVDAHYYSGVAYERLTKAEEAFSEFNAAAELDVYNDQYVMAAAETLIDLKRSDEAVQLLRSSPAYDHSAGIRQTLGYIAQLANDQDTAIDEFQSARLLAPDDFDILEDLTRAQFTKRRYPDAAYGLGLLLREDSYASRRDLLRMQAECMLKLDRAPEARQAYLKLTEDPAGTPDVESWIGLGDVSYTMGDFATLRRAATRVVAIAPDRKEGYVLWSLLHRSQDNTKGALRSIDDAIARDQADPTLRTMRALVLLELGQHEAAREALATALNIDPNNMPARVMLVRMDQGIAGVDTP